MSESAELPNVGLNLALARALGIPHPGCLTALTLEIRPGRKPLVRAEFNLSHPDGLVSVMSEYEIVPRPPELINTEGAPDVPAAAEPAAQEAA